jgi:hypothetical protein
MIVLQQKKITIQSKSFYRLFCSKKKCHNYYLRKLEYCRILNLSAGWAIFIHLYVMWKISSIFAAKIVYKKVGKPNNINSKEK